MDNGLIEWEGASIEPARHEAIPWQLIRTREPGEADSIASVARSRAAQATKRIRAETGLFGRLGSAPTHLFFFLLQALLDQSELFYFSDPRSLGDLRHGYWQTDEDC